MNAIILAAGMGRRMRSMGWDLPKCLLPCPGGTLLDNTLNALSSRGLSRVAIVVGYKREPVESAATKHALHIDFVVNEDYATTNTLHSLYLAREYLQDGSLLFNGDVWFRHGALDPLFQWSALPGVELGRDGGKKAHAASALLVVKRECGVEEVKVILDADNRVQRIGKGLDLAASIGEFVGIARFNATAGSALAQNLEECVISGHSSQFFEFSLDQILNRHSIRAAFISPGDAIEIDTPEDYRAAQSHWL